MKKTLTLPLILSGSLFLGACTSNEINAGIGIAGNLFKGMTVTNDQLAAQARLSAQALDKKQRVASRKSRYTRRLNRLTKNLRVVDGQQFNYKVYLSKKINAFAMPDGTVRVYSGLMDKMNDDELVAVIGHEIAHVKYKHSLQQYKKAYLAKAAKDGLAAYGGSKVSAVASQHGDIALAFMGAQFSQSDELQSDEYGVHLLKKLGRDPYAAASAQRKLQALGGGSGGLFSSHPPSAKRIKKATEVADKVTAKK